MTEENRGRNRAYYNKIKVDTYPGYLLTDNNYFEETEFNIYNNQVKHLKCAKTLYNGCIQLVYLAPGLRSLSSMLAEVDEGELKGLIANLAHEILQINATGVLKCNNVDLSFERVFVEPSSGQINLVYLPIRGKKMMMTEYTKKFCQAIATQLEINFGKGSYKISAVIDCLSKPNVSLEYIERLLGGAIRIEPKREEFIEKAPTPWPPYGICLSSTNEFDNMRFEIRKERYMIGRRPDNDACIAHNRTVSGRHCEIRFVGNAYYVVDLNSSNGTFLNERRLVQGTPEQIRDGDIIVMSDCGFRVSLLF